MGRRVHTLEPGEESGRELTRFRDKDIPAFVFMGILKSHGWTDGRWQEGLYFGGHYKALDGPHITAVIELSAGSGDGLRIKSIYFLQEADWGADKALSLNQVDPMVLSEVLGTLGVLASKAT